VAGGEGKPKARIDRKKGGRGRGVFRGSGGLCSRKHLRGDYLNVLKANRGET